MDVISPYNLMDMWLLIQLLELKLIHVSEKGKRVPGGRLNKKDGLTRYGNSHVKDKTS